jgi:hypothetical protein
MMEPNNPIPKQKDYVKIFGTRLKKVVEGVELMKNFGLDEDILICWLRCKTGLSQADVKLMLKSQQEFYEKLAAKGISDLI